LQEAGKLYEYVTTIERSLQAAEILQAVGQAKDKERDLWMKAAGLREIKRITLSSNKVQCILSVMTPLVAETDIEQVEGGSAGDIGESASGESALSGDLQGKKVSKKKAKRSKSEEEQRFSVGELVIGIVDGPAGGDSIQAVKQLLQTMTQPVDYLSLNSVGLVKEEVTVQPTLLALAVDALDHLGEFILPVIPAILPSDSESAPIPDAAVIDSHNSTEEGVPSAPLLTISGSPLPRKISIIGKAAQCV
jgi:hypothetical protein